MDQPDQVTSVIAIAVGELIQKSPTKIDFSYQKNLDSIVHICLVPKIHFSYYLFDNLTNCNSNYRRQVVWLIDSLKTEAHTISVNFKITM